MKHFLKNGDEIVADNIKLIYVDGKFTLPEDGLTHSVKYVFDAETELECEIEYEPTEGMPDRPYYDKPLIS